jgi:hypothetical protein
VDCFCHFFYDGYYDVPWMNASKMEKNGKKKLERRIPVEHLSVEAWKLGIDLSRGWG